MRLLHAAVLVSCLISGGARSQDADRLAPPQAVSQPDRSASASTKPQASQAHELTETDVDAWLDGYMPWALSSGDIAGAMVAVVKDGKILTKRGYGYADVAKRTPVDPDKTLFRPGSVSKLVTWTAVMQLVGSGKLDLDRDVNDYLDFKIPPYEGRPITLRQIMTHTAGFEEAAKDIISYDPERIEPLGAYLKKWTPERIYAPGSTPAYSNWATTLAGYIVERASGTPFDDYVEQRIFAPLGMNDSTFRQPLPARFAAQMGTGYPRASEPAIPFELIGPAPAGALSSTDSDMARFMIAHLQGGELDGGRILDPATAATMHDSPLDKVDPASLIPPLSRMELGFFETNLNGREVIGHLGDTQTFHTILHLFMKEGVGLYASFNSAGKDGAVGTLRAALLQDFADRYFPATEPDGAVAPDVAAEHARLMSGQWRNSRRSQSNFLALVSMLSQTSVGVDGGGKLVVAGLHDADGATRQWTEIAPFVWRDVHGHNRLAAKVVDGRVTRWSWDMLSPFMVYDPVPVYLSSKWILPAAGASLALLTLSVLWWPTARVIRWRYGAPIGFGGAALAAFRLTQLAILLIVAVAIGWGVTVTRMLSHEDALTESSDPILHTLQIGGAAALAAAALVTLWNITTTWRPGRSRLARLWSVLAFLSVLMISYFAYVCGLLAMTVNY